MRVNYKEFCDKEITPLAHETWVRSDCRRVLKRMSLLGTRHRLHLKTYNRIKNLPQGAILKIQARDLMVLPFMTGKKLGIHNGKTYHIVLIKDKYVGIRLGELAYPKKALHTHTSKTRVKDVRK